jgi:hypothetical protein
MQRFSCLRSMIGVGSAAWAKNHRCTETRKKVRNVSDLHASTSGPYPRSGHSQRGIPLIPVCIPKGRRVKDIGTMRQPAPLLPVPAPYRRHRCRRTQPPTRTPKRPAPNHRGRLPSKDE